MRGCIGSHMRRELVRLFEDDGVDVGMEIDTTSIQKYLFCN
jgi:hypothetical protein